MLTVAPPKNLEDFPKKKFSFKMNFLVKNCPKIFLISKFTLENDIYIKKDTVQYLVTIVIAGY